LKYTTIGHKHLFRSSLMSTNAIDYKKLSRWPKKNQESINELNSDLNVSTNSHVFVTPPTSPSLVKKLADVNKAYCKNHFSLHYKQDKEAIVQLQLENKSLRQQLNLSDDSTTSTVPSNISTMTENEHGIPTKDDEFSSFKKKNESLKLENKKILRDLTMREKEIKALTRRCSEQDKRMKGLKEVKDMAKEIDQLHDEMECKNVIVGKIKEELMEAKKEVKDVTKSLEEANEIERFKCGERNSLKIELNDLTTEKKTLIDEIVKLKAEVVFKDTQLKEGHITIITMTNLKLEREEKLCSLHSQTQLLASSLEKSKIDHLKKIASLKLEIDQLKMFFINEASAAEEKAKTFEQLEKASSEKDKTIMEQKQHCIDLEEKLAEEELFINKAEQKEIESEGKFQQLRRLKLELENQHKSHTHEADEMNARYLKLQNDMKGLKKASSQENKIIMEQNQHCIDLEEKLAEKELVINKTEVQKIESEGKLQQLRSLKLELENQNKSYTQGVDEMNARYLKLQNVMKEEEDKHKKELHNELTKRKDIELNMKTVKSELRELKMRGTNYVDIQKTNLYLEDKIKRQERYLKKKLEQDRKKNRSSITQNLMESPRRQSLQPSRASSRKTI